MPWLAPSPRAAQIVGMFWPHQPYLVPAGQVHRGGASNKILWLSEAEADLVITAHPLQAPEPVIHFDLGGGVGGGQWPCAIDLPSTGCWTLILHWSRHVASVNVLVHSP